MNGDRWERIQSLFHEAGDLPAAEQRPYLERACGGDAGLLAAVAAMLEEDARHASLLDRGIAEVAGRVLEHPAEAPLRTDAFGPYRLTRLLGEGGMGVVYLGEREDLGSVAAIKILRDAWLSPARRERFAAEQRTLAQLNHPSIARLFDADALPDGTPWFAMEYVDGVPITDHCRAHGSPLAERLRLFREVCEAVQHAHRHLVIHRDLKPSNILVTPDGRVKLLDFGIAKPLDALEAESRFQRMADVYREIYDDRHYYIGVALSNIGGVYQERQQYARAEALFREVLRRYADTLPAGHQLVGIARVRLGRQLVRQRRFAEAEREILEGYGILMKQSTPPARWVQMAREDLAEAYAAMNQPERAEPFRAALAARR